MDTVTSPDGTTIAFDRVGQGPALILVGGALQYRAGDPRTAYLAEILAVRFTVYHYDRRGRGDSGDTPPYAVEREVEDLAALIDAAGGSAYVFGNSSGAALALDAARSGSAITKLALYEPPFIIDDSRPPVPEDYVSVLDSLAAAGRRGDAVAYFLTTGVTVPADVVTAMRGQPFWPAFEAVAHTLAYDGRVMGDTMHGSPASLARWGGKVNPLSATRDPGGALTVPTLVIDGGQTPWMSRGADALAAVLPQAQRRTLHDQPHGVAPEVPAPMLVEFFAA
jgi:pimeloyl-ACP methyl ester carboxylesterase